MSFRTSLGQSLVIAGALAAVIAPATSSAAFAAAPSHPAVLAHKPGHVAYKKTNLTTRTAGVHIRSAAKMGKHTKIVATLPKAFSTVTVKCYKTGPSVGGDTTWYKASAPKGFVAGHELNIAHEPALGVSPCVKKK